ncbi:MAG: hypothetical protein Q8L34_00760 [Candidatus Woesearchaeota archaeon]|nr:hypothetical protein [Candidatus Woesearchaeota archaeon]
MTHKSTSPLATYSFPNYRFHEPKLFNLLYDELGKEVLRIHNKQFARTSIADTTEYQPNQPIAYSNVPRALSYNFILHTLTNGRIQVASPVDVVQCWDNIPERDATIPHTNAVIFFSKEGKYQDLPQRVFDLLGKSRSRVRAPFFVTGLGVKKADNEYGFTFVGTGLQQVIEAPYLTKDTRVRYDPKTRTLVEAKNDEEGVQIFVPSDQSGIRGVCRVRSIDLCCVDNGTLDLDPDELDDGLLDSCADGRIQVVQRDLQSRVA